MRRLLVRRGDRQEEGVLARAPRRAAARRAGRPRRARTAADTAGRPARLYGPVKRASTSPSGVPNGGSSGGATYATVGPASTSTSASARAKPGGDPVAVGERGAVVVVGDLRAELEQRPRAVAVVLGLGLVAVRCARPTPRAGRSRRARRRRRRAPATSTSTSSNPRPRERARRASRTRSRTPGRRSGSSSWRAQHADAHAGDAARSGRAARRARRAARPRRPTVRASGPTWSQRRREREDALDGHEPVRRLQADDAAVGGRDADRAARVGAEREVAHAGADERRRAR